MLSPRLKLAPRAIPAEVGRIPDPEIRRRVELAWRHADHLCQAIRRWRAWLTGQHPDVPSENRRLTGADEYEAMELDRICRDSVVGLCALRLVTESMRFVYSTPDEIMDAFPQPPGMPPVGHIGLDAAWRELPTYRNEMMRRTLAVECIVIELGKVMRAIQSAPTADLFASASIGAASAANSPTTPPDAPSPIPQSPSPPKTGAVPTSAAVPPHVPDLTGKPSPQPKPTEAEPKKPKLTIRARKFGKIAYKLAKEGKSNGEILSKIKPMGYDDAESDGAIQMLLSRYCKATNKPRPRPR